MKIKNQRMSTGIISLGILVLISVLIYSCTKSDQLTSSESPAEEVATTIEGEPGAHTYNSQQTSLLEENQWVPCANNGIGEFVHLNGYVHFDNTTVVNDRHYTVVTNININDVSGIGLTTGDRYVASGGGQQLYSGSMTNGQSIASGTTKFKFTGSGPGNNLTVEFKAQVMVNANGEVSNQLLEIKNSCK